MNYTLLKEMLNRIDTTKKYELKNKRIICLYENKRREIIFRNTQVILCKSYVYLPNITVKESKFVLNFHENHLFEEQDLFLDALVIIRNFEYYETKTTN